MSKFVFSIYHHTKTNNGNKSFILMAIAVTFSYHIRVEIRVTTVTTPTWVLSKLNLLVILFFPPPLSFWLCQNGQSSLLFVTKKVVADIFLLLLVALTFLTLDTFFIREWKKNASALILLSIFSKKNSSSMDRVILLTESLK